MGLDRYLCLQKTWDHLPPGHQHDHCGLESRGQGMRDAGHALQHAWVGGTSRGRAKLELLGRGSHHRLSHRKPQKPSHSLETRNKPGGTLRFTLGPAGGRPEARAEDIALWGDLSQPPCLVHRSSIPPDVLPQTSCSQGQRKGACGGPETGSGSL